MHIHPREITVNDAASALRTAVNEILWKKYGLTTAESLRVLADVLGGEIAGIAKLCIREERHGNLDTPGGLAGTERQD